MTSLRLWRRAASTIDCASSTVSASGFSQKTWQPASSAARAYGPVCLRIGVDADDVGPGGLQGLVVVAELGQAAEFLAERARGWRDRG